MAKKIKGSARKLMAVLLALLTGWAAYNHTSAQGEFADSLLLQSSCTDICYVDAVNGNDANTGSTPASAKQTIAAAISAVTTGGEVRILAGTYSESVVVNKNITLQGAGIGQTILQGPGCPTTAGITLAGSHTGITITDLIVTGFLDGINAGQNINFTTSDTLIEDVAATNNCRHGIISQAGVINGFTLNRVNASNNGTALNLTGTQGRGLWLINGVKSDIIITDSNFNGNQLVGIDISDGTVTNLLIEDNNVISNFDSGIAVLGAQGPGSTLIQRNIVTNSGRFGLELKVPSGSGAASGPGSIVVTNNVASWNVAPSTSELRDRAGIAIIRNFAGPLNMDQAVGVVVTGNTVSGYRQISAVGEGFGVVVEGTGHLVADNTLTDNDIGLQLQAGATGALSTPFFDRGGAVQSSAIIRDNQINGNTEGLRVIGSVTGEINGNQIYSNTLDGVAALDGPSLGVNVTGNEICLNGDQGVENRVPAEGVLNATGNWWGSVTGPGLIASGSGDEVSAGVNFADFVTVNPVGSPCTQPSTDLALSFVSPPASSRSGDNFVAGAFLAYNLTVTNNGTVPAVAVRVVLSIADGVTFHMASPGCAVSGLIVTCQLGTLAPGDSVLAMVDVRTTLPANFGPTSITNSASVISNTPDPDLSNNTGSATNIIHRLQLTSLCSPEYNERRVWRIRSSMPVSAGYVWQFPDGLSGQGTAPSGDSTFTTPAAPDPTTVILRIANLDHDVKASRGPCADIAITKTDNQTEAALGAELVYTLTVTNNGLGAANDVTVIDTLPAGLTFLNADPAPTSASGGALTFALGMIPGGGSATLTIRARADQTGEITNTASVSQASEPPDTNPDNNTASDTTMILPPPSLELSVSADRASAAIGETITYNYVVTNTGGTPLNNIMVVDDRLGGIPLTATSLNPGQTASGLGTLTVQEAHLPGPLTNSVVASAIAPDGSQISDQGTTSVDLIPPVTCADITPEIALSGTIQAGGGAAAGYITNNAEVACDFEIGLASYRKFDESIDTQVIFDSVTPTVRIEAGQTISLSVTLPACAGQVDLFYGPVISPTFGSQRYGDRLLAAVHFGGEDYCTQESTPEAPVGQMIGAPLIVLTPEETPLPEATDDPPDDPEATEAP
jgi:uncharacterized repeat protein (TIGR01451 family)